MFLDINLTRELLLKPLLEFKLQSHRDRNSPGLNGKKPIHCCKAATVSATHTKQKSGDVNTRNGNENANFSTLTYLACLQFIAFE